MGASKKIKGAGTKKWTIKFRAGQFMITVSWTIFLFCFIYTNYAKLKYIKEKFKSFSAQVTPRSSTQQKQTTEINLATPGPAGQGHEWKIDKRAPVQSQVIIFILFCKLQLDPPLGLLTPTSGNNCDKLASLFVYLFICKKKLSKPGYIYYKPM